MNVNDYVIADTVFGPPVFLGEREDFHESRSNGSFKIAYVAKFKLVLLFATVGHLLLSIWRVQCSVALSSHLTLIDWQGEFMLFNHG